MAAPALDVLVRGAGPVGCAAALALRGAGPLVALLGNAPAWTGFRPIALSYASRLILERLGAWPQLGATPIERIVVSQAGSCGRASLDSGDAGVPALGYVTEYAGLLGALRAQAAELCTPEPLAARCIVH